MFYKDGIILVSFVDDLLIFGSDKEAVDSTLDALESEFKLTKDDDQQDVFAYLGISVERGRNAAYPAVISKKN